MENTSAPDTNSNFNADSLHPAGNPTSANSVLFAALSYVFILWILGLVIAPEKDDPFVKHHVNNGILLTVIGLALSVFHFIPLVGNIIGGLFNIAMLIVAILGIVFAAQKQYFKIPVLSEIKIVK